MKFSMKSWFTAKATDKGKSSKASQTLDEPQSAQSENTGIKKPASARNSQFPRSGRSSDRIRDGSTSMTSHLN